MSFRDFVVGSDACAPDGAGPSNAASSLADALLGGRAKQQAQLHEVGAHMSDQSAQCSLLTTPPFGFPFAVQRSTLVSSVCSCLVWRARDLPRAMPPTGPAQQR